MSAPGRRCDTSSGLSVRWLLSTVRMVPENGGEPTIRSCSMMPTEYMSAAGPTSRPDSISGEMNAGVPTMPPTTVSRCSPTSRATPKSVTFTKSGCPFR